jgi:hypothetical protein
MALRQNSATIWQVESARLRRGVDWRNGDAPRHFPREKERTRLIVMEEFGKTAAAPRMI